MSTDQTEYTLDDTIEVTVELRNIGDRTSNELVAVYSQDRVASITPSVDRLRHFQRVFVGAGETVKAKARISVDELGFINRNNEYTIEPGAFGIRIGNQVVEIEVKNENK